MQWTVVTASPTLGNEQTAHNTDTCSSTYKIRSLKQGYNPYNVIYVGIVKVEIRKNNEGQDFHVETAHSALTDCIQERLARHVKKPAIMIQIERKLKAIFEKGLSK